MHRFYLPPDQCTGDTLELRDREAHHALQVLRLRAEDEVVVLDGAGQVLTCRVRDLVKRTIRLAVTQRERISLRPCRITLVQAIPKGKAFDTIIQKTTELGAARIVPVITERVVAQPRQEDAAAKVEKWSQIAIESIKQCGSPWLTQIEPPISFAAATRRSDLGEFAVVASLEPEPRDLRAVLAEDFLSRRRLPASAVAWIGPEGDFTPAELATLKTTGTQPITLGSLVLRADTAAIACLALLNYELQRRD